LEQAERGGWRLFMGWQLMQTVPGIQDRSAANILAETGADMTQFPSAKKLGSWAESVQVTTAVQVRTRAVIQREEIRGCGAHRRSAPGRQLQVGAW
jgi:transposase